MGTKGSCGESKSSQTSFSFCCGTPDPAWHFSFDVSRMISPTLKEEATDCQFGLKEDGCQQAAIAAQIELDRMTALGLEVAILHVDMKG